MYTLGETEYYVPARLDDSEMERACELARRVYVLLDCRDVARVDMVVDTEGTPYVLECSTLPWMTETSVLVMSAQAAGIKFEDLVDRVARAALGRR